MDRKALEKLRLDRRLIGRRGWIADEDVQEAIEKLPDAASKAETTEPGPEPPSSDSGG